MALKRLNIPPRHSHLNYTAGSPFPINKGDLRYTVQSTALPHHPHADINTIEYWIKLGQSMVFKGQTLVGCLLRICHDILKICNFNDPKKVRRPGHSLTHEFIVVVRTRIFRQNDPAYRRVYP